MIGHVTYLLPQSLNVLSTLEHEMKVAYKYCCLHSHAKYGVKFQEMPREINPWTGARCSKYYCTSKLQSPQLKSSLYLKVFVQLKTAAASWVPVFATLTTSMNIY